MLPLVAYRTSAQYKSALYISLTFWFSNHFEKKKSGPFETLRYRESA